MSKIAVEYMEIKSGIPFPKHKQKSLVGMLYKMKMDKEAPLIVGLYSNKLAHYVSSAISKYKKNYPNKIFSQRKLEDGTLGVWRLK